MDPRSTAQDVNRCDLCETAIVHSYCDFCHVNLCKPCVVDHISDEYDKHKIVPFQKRRSTLIHSKCETHPHRNCEFQCKDCNNMFVCSSCMASKQHKGHNFVDVTEVYKAKKDDIKKDTKELENHISPTYEEIALDLDNQLANLDGGYDKLTTTISKQGEQWHREIDIVINKMKTEISDIKVKHKELLQKHLNEIKQIQSLIKKTLHALRKIEKSTEVSPIVEYSSKIREFSKFPPKVRVSMPTFIPKPIDRDKLYTFFGQIMDDKDGIYINKEGGDDHIFFKPVIQLPEKVECQKNLIENPPTVSAEPQQSGATFQESPEEEDGSDDKDDDEEGDDDDEYDDVEEILLEKRVTFQMMEGNQWQNKGTGVLRVIYDDDVNANKVTFTTTDKKEDLCNHLIAMESIITLDKSKHFCEWHPIDFATDEPIRRGFRAVFSSVPAAEEFYKSFQQGRTLARDSEISERDMEPRELLVPEVHGRGANDN